MKNILEVLVFIVIGIILLWFGYTLFIGIGIPVWGSLSWPRKNRNRRERIMSFPGDPQTCPVCSRKLGPGELVSSLAFPSLNGGKDRFMHIKGCVHCLLGDRDRVCPVCGTVLKNDEILISRLFERQGRRSHVHVLGCSRCKGPRSGRPSPGL